MRDEELFYGLLIREEQGWSTRSVVRVGARWEAVIARRRGRAIEAAAGAHPLLALRTAWRLVERRLAAGEDLEEAWWQANAP